MNNSQFYKDVEEYLKLEDNIKTAGYSPYLFAMKKKLKSKLIKSINQNKQQLKLRINEKL